MTKEFIYGAIRKPITSITISAWNYRDCCIYRYGDHYGEDEGYIININKFNIKIYVINGCKEFNELKDLLSNILSIDNESIYKFIMTLAIHCSSDDEIFNIIKNTETEFFDKGYKKAQDDMKKVLGI